MVVVVLYNPWVTICGFGMCMESSGNGVALLVRRCLGRPVSRWSYDRLSLATSVGSAASVLVVYSVPRSGSSLLSSFGLLVLFSCCRW